MFIQAKLLKINLTASFRQPDNKYNNANVTPDTKESHCNFIVILIKHLFAGILSLTPVLLK